MLTQKTNIAEDLLLHHQTSSCSQSTRLQFWSRPRDHAPHNHAPPMTRPHNHTPVATPQ